MSSYLSNTLIFQYFWFTKVDGMNLFFLLPINFWFCLNKEVDKAGEAGVGVGGGNEILSSICSGLAKQTQHLKPKALGPKLENVLY